MNMIYTHGIKCNLAHYNDKNDKYYMSTTLRGPYACLINRYPCVDVFTEKKTSGNKIHFQ